MDTSACVVFPPTIQFRADRAYVGLAASCQHSITEYPSREARAEILKRVCGVVSFWHRAARASAQRERRRSRGVVV